MKLVETVRNICETVRNRREIGEMTCMQNESGIRDMHDGKHACMHTTCKPECITTAHAAGAAHRLGGPVSEPLGLLRL